MTPHLVDRLVGGDDPATGLDYASYVTCEDIKSISDRRLVTRAGTVPTEAMFEMERALRVLLRL